VQEVPIASLSNGDASDYTPQPGDVVEFECSGEANKGIVFKTSFYPKEMSLTCHLDGSYCRFSWEDFKNKKKVGYTDAMQDKIFDDPSEAISIAKAYFSRPFKVGDRVKIARKFTTSDCYWVSAMDSYVGNEFDVCNIDGVYVHFEGMLFSFPIESLEHA
jgi:hypothetical protein